MTSKLSRRDFLLAASGAAGAAALNTRADSWANASEGGGVAHASDLAAIDQSLRQAVARHAVAGVVAMAATPLGMLYEGSFGAADQQAGATVSADSVFWLLSMTKAVTAAACLQLIEQGKLGLDQLAEEVLPELKSPRVLEGFDSAGRPKLRPAKRPMTVRHLLTHTSGFTYPIWSENIFQYEKVTGMPDIAYSQNAALAAPLEFDPGERWAYGIGMDWVGKLIEAVSNQSLEVYFRENIFAPLGMNNTGFLISSAQKRRVATLYQRDCDGSLKPLPFEMPQRPEFFSGGGGLFGTPRDFMRFLQMLIRGGEIGGARILLGRTVASMFENQIGGLNVVEMKTAQPAYSHSFDEFPGMNHKWGLSFDINTQRGPHGRSPGSASWAGLLNCYFWLDPVKQVTGGMFTQTLPFYDPAIVKLYGEFEHGVYLALERN